MPTLTFRGVTLSYPALWEPRKQRPMPGQAPRADKYGATFLIPISMDIKDQQAVVLEMLREKHKNAEAMIKEGMLHWPFNTKNLKKDGSPRFDTSKFKCSINASSDRAPGVVDRYVDPATGKTALLTDRNKIYAGCVVNVLLNPFYFNNEATGVSFGLQVVQWWDDGERLDSRIAPEDAFKGEPLPEGDLSHLAAAESGPAAGPGSKSAALNDLFS